jgi:hypothetical protein
MRNTMHESVELKLDSGGRDKELDTLYARNKCRENGTIINKRTQFSESTIAVGRKCNSLVVLSFPLFSVLPTLAINCALLNSGEWVEEGPSFAICQHTIHIMLFIIRRFRLGVFKVYSASD